MQQQQRLRQIQAGRIIIPPVTLTLIFPNEAKITDTIPITGYFGDLLGPLPTEKIDILKDGILCKEVLTDAAGNYSTSIPASLVEVGIHRIHAGARWTGFFYNHWNDGHFIEIKEVPGPPPPPPKDWWTQIQEWFNNLSDIEKAALIGATGIFLIGGILILIRRRKK